MFKAISNFFRRLFRRSPRLTDPIEEIALQVPEKLTPEKVEIQPGQEKNEFAPLEERFIYSQFQSDVHPERVGVIAGLLRDDLISAEWEAQELSRQATIIEDNIQAIAAIDPSLAEKIAEYVDDTPPLMGESSCEYTASVASMMDQQPKPIGSDKDFLEALVGTLPKCDPDDAISGYAHPPASQPHYCVYFKEPEREYEGVKWDGAVEVCSRNPHPIMGGDLVGWKKVATHVRLEDDVYPT